MTVKQTELVNGTPASDLHAPKGRRKASAVVSRAQLDRLQGPFERFIGWALLALSFAGSVFALNDGEPWPIATEALIGGLALQGVLTLVQWVWGIRRRGLRWYNGAAILFGTGLTVAGWAPLLIAPMTALWGRVGQVPAFSVAGIGGTVFLAWATLVALALLNETLPEYILVD